MGKRQLRLLIFGILMVTIICIGLGLFFKQSDTEKRNGLTDIFDVNRDGTIAFVYENKGQQEIYIQTKKKQEQALQLEEKQTIADISFSPNGTLLVYSLIDMKNEESSVHVLDTRSFDTKEIFHEEALITEIAYHPNDDQILYYTKAMTYENYSPIARANPHDFDIFSYDINADEEKRYTELEAYSMQSLQVSEDASSVYVQMMDDEDAESADDIFDAKQKVFQIPLDDPEQKEIISDPDRSIDIYDFALLPEEEAMIFQSISNEKAGETFQYELYYDGLDEEEVKQLTDLQSYAGKPVIGPDEETVYFIVNTKFAQKQPEHHLYKMNMYHPEPTEVDIDIED